MGRWSFGLALALAIGVFGLCGCAPRAEDRPFGLHGLTKHTLRGILYNLPKGTRQLPDFAHLSPKATVFAPWLNVQVANDVDGFDGLTNRNEWFALDYKAALKVTREGEYAFRLVSDDGSRLLIDGRAVINNDGVHFPPATAAGTVRLAAGEHAVEVQYFKGPRPFKATLQLSCTAPGGPEGLFPLCGGLTLETPSHLSDQLWWIWLLGLFVAAAGWWFVAGRSKAA